MDSVDDRLKLGVVALPVAVLCLVWAHAAAAVVAALTGFDPSPHGWTITAGASIVALVLVARFGAALGRRLPPWLVGGLGGSRLRRWLFVGLSLVAFVQLARLSTWVTDPDSSWFLSTDNPLWADHECLPAYVHGGELALGGEPNVYDAAHYPGLNPAADPHTAIHGMTVEDPYQYPPQFLLWPAAAVLASHHYPAIKAVWFAMQTTLLLLLSYGLALFIGRETGRRTLFLVPLFLSAFPTLHALQYGQFHLAAVLLSVAAMLLFEARRDVAGGALLSVAILAKIFPGVLVLLLLAQRRFRAVGLTVAFGAGLSLLALAIFGTDPFTAFVGYQLPRLADGAAFAFGEAWPELADLIVADNQGIYGLMRKLEAMGLSQITGDVAAWINRAYGVVLAGVALVAGRALLPRPRAERAMVWIGLVGLASLMSTGAFGDYVPLTAVWLGTLLMANGLGTARALWLAPTLVFPYTLLGTSPIGSYFEPSVMIPLSVLGVLAMLAIFSSPLATIFRRRESAHAQPGRMSSGGELQRA